MKAVVVIMCLMFALALTWVKGDVYRHSEEIDDLKIVILDLDERESLMLQGITELIKQLEETQERVEELEIMCMPTL